MSRANEPAHPTLWDNDGDLNASAPDGTVVSPQGFVRLTGLTIREHFAAMALQGYLANPEWTQEGHERVARNCVLSADALIAELAKPVTP